MKKKVFVGVSGGIDSAAAVLLLREAGYEVTGVALQMTASSPDADSLSAVLGIPVIAVDARELFARRIVQPFIGAYLRGETPSPCVECNASVKWAVLRETAGRYAENAFLATGHYCRVVRSDGLFYIAKGADPRKDQSYYLWRLSQEVLSRAVLPLGGLLKTGVREWMAARGYGGLAAAKESMGVCFLEKKEYGVFLRAHCPGLETLENGLVEDTAGNPVGRHAGYPFYTAGQRKGPGIPSGMRVVRTDARRNVVVVGAPAGLFVREFTLRDWRVTCPDEFFSSAAVSVAVRGIGENPAGFIRAGLQGDRLHIRLQDAPAWALAPGQPAVFYIGDRVVGGGIVEKI